MRETLLKLPTITKMRGNHDIIALIYYSRANQRITIK